MASAGHPFVNPPRLPSPTKARIHARKPSRSPVRHNVRDSDTLLRDLSPTATLRAFVTDPGDMSSSSDALVASIRSATMSERGLGAKAAQTCLDLRNWAREIEHWEWPGTFAEPRLAQKTDLPIESHRRSHVGSESREHAVKDHEEYWGSLPARVVQEYERRADEIGQGLDDIDVEELKDYVLNSHYRVNSRPPSRGDSIGDYSSTAAELKRLDDFTALVTATILQALPFLSRLHSLLDMWTIRLIILRGAPRFLHDLRQSKLDLDRCWAAIASSPNIDSLSSNGTDYNRATMLRMKASIEHQIGSLGRRLDRFLDDLEGRNECVPDEWIDEFESLESAYSAFIVHAERTVVENEWRDHHNAVTPELHAHSNTAIPPGLSGREALPGFSENEDPMSDDDAVRRPSQSIRTSVDEAQLARLLTVPETQHASATETEQNSIAGTPSDDRSWSASNRSVSVPMSMDSQHIPSLVANADDELQTSAGRDGISRSASTNSQHKAEVTGSIAAKRAAFLRDIERNQSLNKSTQSPVRPFERASNAFTRLFKKDRSPEHVVPKRIGSRLASDTASSAERSALSPVSFASSRFNSVSPTMSTHSGKGSSKSSVDDLEQPKVQSPPSDNPDSSVDGNLVRTAYHAQATKSAESSAAGPAMLRDLETDDSSSSPFHSPEREDFPEHWPFTTLPEHESRVESSTASARMAGAGSETPTLAMDTDAFDRTFIESFPQPGSQFEQTSSPRGSVRRASLPRSQRMSSGEVPRLLPEPKWAPVHQVERRASASSTRPKTAPSQPAQTIAAHNLLVKSNAELEPSDGETASVYKVKRASIASIEAFSRSELKSIDVPRNSRQSSVSSRRSPPRTPAGYSRRASAIEPSVERASVDDSATAQSTSAEAAVLPRRSSLPTQHSPPSKLGTPIVTHTSPVAEQDSTSPTSPSAPLNMVMRKLRSSKNVTRLEKASASFPNGTIDSPRHDPHADHFDRHVSEVLETLPAPIRFKARAGAETPISRMRGYSGPRAKASSLRAAPKGGDMIIAPADSSPKKSRSSADPEVKLYHLTHTGREDPIKLFVRLVGEGERVMVRVGGGWADLADYLRDFANHHGSRTVSEGNLEVAALPTAPLSARKTSNPAEYLGRAKTPTTPREITRPSSSGDEDMPLKRPPFDMRESALSVAGTPVHAATISTPKSSKSSSSNSRPSTAGASRPSSRQAQNVTAGDLGLSGPSSATKRVGLPAEKERWVEGMIERAKKSASAEKSREDREKYFGELGKAGGTRRVIFRSGSGTGTPAPLSDKTNR
ncbi:putative GAR domain-containing protein [Septoria linicola]|nr:putative GAR domain-containing protein [Septoria linicola]